jgi:hypothetical protein
VPWTIGTTSVPSRLLAVGSSEIFAIS